MADGMGNSGASGDSTREFVISRTFDAPRDLVWKAFTDLTCWAEWNHTARDIVSRSGTMEQGSRFRFCLRPFAIPIHIDPVIDDLCNARDIS